MHGLEAVNQVAFRVTIHVLEQIVANIASGFAALRPSRYRGTNRNWSRIGGGRQAASQQPERANRL
jgi:hypothetical protein